MHTATQENQGINRGTDEGVGREKLKKVDGDFPACMRRESDNNDDNTRSERNKEEADSSITRSMEMCHYV